MLIWRGWGILTILIISATWIVTFSVLRLLLSTMGQGSWVVVISSSLALVAGAAANWMVGRRFNGKPPRELVDPKTGENVLLVRRHELFFFKMEYWSIPVVIVALFELMNLLR